ncbi:MAG: hypothetical protein ACREP6_15130 [Candidatus Binataceae bacterium]
MRRNCTQIALSMLLLAGLAFGTSVPARAFSISSLIGRSNEHNDNIKKIHVPDLVALMRDKNAHVVILDANLPAVREKYGIIPGAKLLPSAGNYDVATALPANKHARLVFYCTNRR